MKSSTHGILQLVLTAIQGLNMADIQGALALLPPKWGPYIAVALSSVQAVLGIWNHYFNPDGTNAKVAYTPK